MGEAKRRKDKYPRYGHVPKAGKGIVVSPPVTIGDNSMSITLGIDPLELRRAVLFWDRICRPENNIISIGLSADERFLIECGILQRYKITALQYSGEVGALYAAMHLKAFSNLEEKEPGLWALSEGPNSFNLKAGEGFNEGRGALVELHRAIPLPEKDVPINDILEFKAKRSDEIFALNQELDGLFSRISNASDTNFEICRAISEIDRRCADIISVGKESNIKLSTSNSVSYGVSFDLMKLLLGAGLGVLMNKEFDLPMATLAIGAAALSTLTFNVDLGGKLERSNRSKKLALSPYRVVSRLINEPI